MGDVADMMLDGTLCQGCGELLSDDAPGHPRTCAACSSDQAEDVLERVLPRTAATLKSLQAEYDELSRTAAVARLTPLLRRTYEAVPESGETTTRDVANLLKQQQPNVATRLKKLWTAGLVKRDGTGKQQPYRWSRA